jgi:transcriptional regulator with PAS, ATPase and Fis domain
VPNELFESEFFGHSRGAFTGAVRRRTGYIKSAEGGMLFLDEISELTRSQQAKLLRVLQENKLRVVGEAKEIDIDIRLILASNERIEVLLDSGRLREDFYYRVCSEIIRLKPLRERPDDIAALFAYYLNSENEEILAERDLINLLNNYLWPGNVRELIKVVKSISIKSGNIHVVTLDDLPAWIRDSNQCYSLKQEKPDSLDKKTLIENTLKELGGNKSAAAKKMGISRSTLYRWMGDLNL